MHKIKISLREVLASLMPSPHARNLLRAIGSGAVKILDPDRRFWRLSRCFYAQGDFSPLKLHTTGLSTLETSKLFAFYNSPTPAAVQAIVCNLLRKPSAHYPRKSSKDLKLQERSEKVLITQKGKCTSP